VRPLSVFAEACDVTCAVRLSRIIAGAAASLAVGLLSDAAPVQAQGANTATQMTPLPARRAEPQRRVPVPVITDDDDTTPATQPNIAKPAEDDGRTDETPTDPVDGDDPGRQQARRNMDGQPLVGNERDTNQDGIPQVGEPEPLVKDGEPDTGRDPRSKADIDAFERPAAGYDAVAFQIELEPILDRRPSRLARFEPYDPIGIKRGSWIIFPEIEFGMGATSNVRRAPDGAASAVFDVTPTVRAVTNWRVHAIELRATGFASAFPGFATENDKAAALEARGRYDFSRRTNVEALLSTALSQEARSAPNADAAARDRTNILTTRAATALNHRFNRLTVQLRGGISDVEYGNDTTVTGDTVDNRTRNYQQRDVGSRATWEFTPTLFAFTDVALNDRHYAAAPTDGIKRDSSGYRAVAGLSFGNAGRIWRGEIGVGYGAQRPDDGRILTTSGFILDANLAYRASELTSLLFTARTDFNDSTTPGQSGSLVRTAGLELRHAFRRHLIGTAGLRHTLTDYQGVSLRERDTTADLGVEYFLNQRTTLFSRYSHTWYDTTTAGGDYTVDTIRFGVRIRQ
jgi:hypothetical protein